MFVPRHWRRANRNVLDLFAGQDIPPAPAGRQVRFSSILLFPGNFAPKGWAFCDGQLLPIQDNLAVFSILGTTYGGDGRATFALPGLRGRAPMHPGQGPGLTPRHLGDKTGTETTPFEPLTLHTSEEAGMDTVTSAALNSIPTQSNMQPSLGINFIICLYGMFPSRA